MENWRGAACAARQHRVKAAKVKVVVGLVPAQVQVDGAVGRGHGLLEQQQVLQQRGLADELLPSSMVTGAICTGRCRARP